MKKLYSFLLVISLLFSTVSSKAVENFPEKKIEEERSEFSFIGYYFVRSTMTNISTSNELLKGQIVGRLFGYNRTVTEGGTARYTEQRFMPMITYSPRLFDGWASMRMSFELDWTWGDDNYGSGGNFGGAYGADFVNLQTQNLFLELHPSSRYFINIGLLRLYDNTRVPYYTGTETLINTGYRLAFFGSDATGISGHYYISEAQRLKMGAYQFYENNVEQKDDVIFTEIDYEQDFEYLNTVGFSLWYLRDTADGEGGVSVLKQGLNSTLCDYNGVVRFDLEDEAYKANVAWVGSHFHRNPTLDKDRFGYNGFLVYNTGQVTTDTRTIDIAGYAANLRLAYKYGQTANSKIVFDAIYTSGDGNGSSDDKYTGVLTGNNWTTPGAVFFSHNLYLLLPYGSVVNRYIAATIDIQNMGYGLTAGSFCAEYDLIPNKLRLKSAVGLGMASETPDGLDKMMGSEVNFNIRYSPKVFMDLELHAAYMKLGNYYDSRLVNGVPDDEPNHRPDDPWTVFASLKWIMF